jgi:hypothetical protein
LSRAHKSPELRDQGTPEAQAKRLALVNGSARPELASTPADIMFAREILNREQHAAALRFRMARAACFGTPLANATPGREPDEQVIARNERRYAQLLARLSVDQQLAVIDLALDLQPGWLRRILREAPPLPEDARDREALLSGLDALK